MRVDRLGAVDRNPAVVDHAQLAGQRHAIADDRDDRARREPADDRLVLCEPAQARRGDADMQGVAAEPGVIAAGVGRRAARALRPDDVPRRLVFIQPVLVEDERREPDRSDRVGDPNHILADFKFPGERVEPGPVAPGRLGREVRVLVAGHARDDEDVDRIEGVAEPDPMMQGTAHERGTAGPR
jgi:hypothetical protein